MGRACVWHVDATMGNFLANFCFSFDRWSIVVMVCMKIHNLCINESCTVPTRRYAEDIREGDEWVVLDNTRDDDALHRVRGLGERRRRITASLEHNGIIRPVHAQMNT